MSLVHIVFVVLRITSFDIKVTYTVEIAFLQVAGAEAKSCTHDVNRIYTGC